MRVTSFLFLFFFFLFFLFPLTGQFVAKEIEYTENKVRSAVLVERGQRRGPFTLLGNDRSHDRIGFPYMCHSGVVSIPRSLGNI